MLLSRNHRAVRIFQQPVAAAEYPDLNVRLIGKQRQSGQRRRGRQVMRDQQTAVRIDDGAAIERRRRQVDAQGFDLLQHGFGRTTGGQAEQHAGLAQGADRFDRALAEAVIGQQQSAVHVTEQKTDGMLR